jgi:hypothetical protein
MGEFKEKHGVWDPMPELTITSPYVHSRVDSNTFTMGNPMPESTLTLRQSWLFIPQSGSLDLASGDFLAIQRSADILSMQLFCFLYEIIYLLYSKPYFTHCMVK